MAALMGFAGQKWPFPPKAYMYLYSYSSATWAYVVSPSKKKEYCTRTSRWWWWLQHPSKDDEACAISGKRTTNSKLNTSIIGGCGVGVRIVDFFSNIRA